MDDLKNSVSRNIIIPKTTKVFFNSSKPKTCQSQLLLTNYQKEGCLYATFFFYLVFIDKWLFVLYIEIVKAFLLQPPAISAVRSLARMPFLFNLNSISTKRIDGVELGGGYGRICARNTPNENGQKD